MKGQDVKLKNILIIVLNNIYLYNNYLSSWV